MSTSDLPADGPADVPADVLGDGCPDGHALSAAELSELLAADVAAVVAVSRLAGRSGAKEFQFSCQDPDAPYEQRGWWVMATYRGAKLIADGHASPAAACDALAARMLDRGQCQGCGKLSFVKRPEGYRLADEQMVARTKREGICRWHREGDRWLRACGALAPPGSSREKLAMAMAAVGVIPAEQIAAARDGRYDDYLSEAAFPQQLLLAELAPYGLEVAQLVGKVKDGEFEATHAEAEEWVSSPEGQAVLAEFLKPGGKPDGAAKGSARGRRPRGGRRGKRK